MANPRFHATSILKTSQLRGSIISVRSKTMKSVEIAQESRTRFASPSHCLLFRYRRFHRPITIRTALSQYSGTVFTSPVIINRFIVSSARTWHYVAGRYGGERRGLMRTAGVGADFVLNLRGDLLVAAMVICGS